MPRASIIELLDRELLLKFYVLCCYLATILDERAATTNLLLSLRVLELKNQSEHIGAKKEIKEKGKNTYIKQKY